eukprot:8211215-Pyramimonas_sp.AAC.2
MPHRDAETARRPLPGIESTILLPFTGPPVPITARVHSTPQIKGALNTPDQGCTQHPRPRDYIFGPTKCQPTRC